MNHGEVGLIPMSLLFDLNLAWSHSGSAPVILSCALADEADCCHFEVWALEPHPGHCFLRLRNIGLTTLRWHGSSHDDSVSQDCSLFFSSALALVLGCDLFFLLPSCFPKASHQTTTKEVQVGNYDSTPQYHESVLLTGTLRQWCAKKANLELLNM